VREEELGKDDGVDEVEDVEEITVIDRWAAGG
jgi:hypothetical protein